LRRGTGLRCEPGSLGDSLGDSLELRRNAQLLGLARPELRRRRPELLRLRPELLRLRPELLRLLRPELLLLGHASQLLRHTITEGRERSTLGLGSGLHGLEPELNLWLRSDGLRGGRRRNGQPG